LTGKGNQDKSEKTYLKISSKKEQKMKKNGKKIKNK